MSENLIQTPLFEKIKNYLILAQKNERIFLYVPYIKTKILQQLVDEIDNRITIITTWQMNDLISGSSELELFEFTQREKIDLYIHNKIHLKVYSINLETAIASSGNISQRGLLPNGNYEFGVFVEKLSTHDRMYLEKIRNEAIFVNEEVYQKYLKDYEKCKKAAPPRIEFEDPVITLKKDYFLKSALPMTENIQDLVEGYQKINSNNNPSENPEITSCIYHDLANYEIEIGLSRKEFLHKLKKQFFSHPFICLIDRFLVDSDRPQFGVIRDFVRNNCTDVPLPRPFELNKNINVIYDWFVFLGDKGQYEKYRFGKHTESLRKNF